VTCDPVTGPFVPDDLPDKTGPGTDSSGEPSEDRVSRVADAVSSGARISTVFDKTGPAEGKAEAPGRAEAAGVGEPPHGGTGSGRHVGGASTSPDHFGGEVFLNEIVEARMAERGIVQGQDADGNLVRLELDYITVTGSPNVTVAGSEVTLIGCRVARADLCHIRVGRGNVLDLVAASMEEA